MLPWRRLEERQCPCLWGCAKIQSLQKPLWDSRKLSPETPWQSRDPITTRWGRILPRKLSPICPEMTNEEASRVASKTSGLWAEECLSQEQRRPMELLWIISREQSFQMQSWKSLPSSKLPGDSTLPILQEQLHPLLSFQELQELAWELGSWLRAGKGPSHTN